MESLTGKKKYLRHYSAMLTPSRNVHPGKERTYVQLLLTLVETCKFKAAFFFPYNNSYSLKLYVYYVDILL